MPNLNDLLSIKIGLTRLPVFWKIKIFENVNQILQIFFVLTQGMIDWPFYNNINRADVL